MNIRLASVLTAIIVVMSLPGVAEAQRAGARHNLGQPDYERTAAASESAVLVHTKSPGLHTVCQSLGDTEKAVIHYDNNELTLAPGHCVEVEASYITASSSGSSSVDVFGYHHITHERHGE